MPWPKDINRNIRTIAHAQIQMPSVNVDAGRFWNICDDFRLVQPMLIPGELRQFCTRFPLPDRNIPISVPLPCQRQRRFIIVDAMRDAGAQDGINWWLGVRVKSPEELHCKTALQRQKSRIKPGVHEWHIFEPIILKPVPVLRWPVSRIDCRIGDRKRQCPDCRDNFSSQWPRGATGEKFLQLQHIVHSHDT